MDMTRLRFGFGVIAAILAVSCTRQGPGTPIDSYPPLSPFQSPSASLVVKAKLGTFDAGRYFVLLLSDQRGGVVLRRSFVVSDRTTRSRALLAPGAYGLIWDTAACRLNACPDTKHLGASAARNESCRSQFVIEAGDALRVVLKDVSAVVEHPRPRDRSGCHATIPQRFSSDA
jgi:hypothetical protein